MSEPIASGSGPLGGPLRKRESSMWEREANDWYVEPSWCSARLFDEVRFTGPIWDPACGGGNIIRSADSSGFRTWGTDVVRRPCGCDDVLDFMAPGGPTRWKGDIVSNPPFGLCDDRRAGKHPWVERCLSLATGKVALLMPANWVQGERRSRWLETSPLAMVLFIAPRPSMPPGHVLAAGGKPGNGTTDYAWFVWEPGWSLAPAIGWLRRDNHNFGEVA